MSRLKRGLKGVCIIFSVVFSIVLTLFAVAAIRTCFLEELDITLESSVSKEFAVSQNELQKYAEVLGGALKFKTISLNPGEYNTEQLEKLHLYLRQKFPSVFKSALIDAETINNYSLLFTLKGSDSSLSPYMLTSHLDVVPVDESLWSRDPFLGEVVTENGEECVWGRGAIDAKASVVAILSAVDQLILSGWRPKRTFFIGFGHDEEVFGLDGAAEISKVLKSRNVSLDFLLDEGMPLVQGFVPGIQDPIALIGVTEKGRMDVRLTATGVGGHSSFPHDQQAVKTLASALHNLYQNPQPNMFGYGPEEDTFRYLAPKASWPYKLVFGNTWLFGPLIGLVLSNKAETNALVRTTTAATIVRAGVKNNVVPSTAEAIVNHRIHPSQSLQQVIAHDIAAIGDANVKVEMLNGVEAQRVSSYGAHSEPYKAIAAAVKHVYPESVAAPGILIANTDTRHYTSVASNLYRLLPFVLSRHEVSGIHGLNECLPKEGFEGAVKFYIELIIRSETYKQL